MAFREIICEDIPILFDIRTSTDENKLSMRDLTEIGITEESLVGKMQNNYKGWLCEIDNKPVDFAMGDKETGELWVIAVLPNYINRGIGSRLIRLVEDWLFASGCNRLWLATDIDEKLRAYSLYKKNGWKDNEIKNDLRYMIKENK